MKDKCLACGAPIKDADDFKQHIRSHKLRIAEYWHTYLPRYDKHDGSIIRFKNEEFYLTSDFNSRANLCKWLEAQDRPTARAYCEKILTERRAKKSLVYAPTQVELRTILAPGIFFFNQNIGDYHELCEQLGFKLRFSQYKFNNRPNDLRGYKILIDTREQRPLEISGNTEFVALKYGDYAMLNKDMSKGLAIERKAPNDFYGTLSKGYERFQREIERAQADKAYLIVLVEATINDVTTLPDRPPYFGRLNIAPEFIFHRMRDLIQAYDNVQFLFVDGREEASRIVKKLFAHAEECSTTDLQYAYDTKQL